MTWAKPPAGAQRVGEEAPTAATGEGGSDGGAGEGSGSRAEEEEESEDPAGEVHWDGRVRGLWAAGSAATLDSALAL